MTKYSPESKRKEGKGHPILPEQGKQFNLAELVMQQNAILMTVATELANIDNKLEHLGMLGYLEK